MSVINNPLNRQFIFITPQPLFGNCTEPTCLPENGFSFQNILSLNTVQKHVFYNDLQNIENQKWNHLIQPTHNSVNLEQPPFFAFQNWHQSDKFFSQRLVISLLLFTNTTPLPSLQLHTPVTFLPFFAPYSKPIKSFTKNTKVEENYNFTWLYHFQLI